MKLLVAIDGSLHANRALDTACSMVNKDRDHVLLIAAVEEVVSMVFPTCDFSLFFLLSLFFLKKSFIHLVA